MQFLLLKISNFCSIQYIELPLSGQGMVLISGENKDAPLADSNGSGKSLLLDALCWALWGQTVRGLKGDEVVNKQVGKDCSVTVTFEDGGQQYAVTRTRKMSGNKKPNDVIFTVDGADACGASMAMTDESIVRALGLDFSTFRAMMPGAGLRAANMTDKEVKLLLEDLLQTQVLSDAHELAKEESKRLQQEMDAVDAAKERAMKEWAASSARLLDYQENHTNFEDDKEKTIGSIQSEVSDQMRVIDECEAVAKKWAKTKKKIDGLNEKMEANKVQQTAAREASRALMVRRMADCSVIEKTISKHSAELDLLNRKLVQFKSLGQCPTCYQEIAPEFRDKHEAEAQAVIVQKSKELKDLEAQLATVQAEYDEKVALAVAKVQDLDFVERSIDTEIYNLRKDEVPYQVASEKWKMAKARIKKLSDECWAVQHKDNPFQGLIERETVLHDEAQTAVADLADRYLKLADEKDLYDFWVTGFSASGLRSYILEHVTPILNDKVQHYADILTDGEMTVTFNTKDSTKSGETREKFNIEVTQKHGGDSYASCSAGERSRADLAICLALGDLASLRANKVIPFRFLDEPFESVDDTGTDAIVKLLNEQREKYDTVYVITHKDHFKQLFEKKLTVIKQNGFSTLDNPYVVLATSWET